MLSEEDDWLQIRQPDDETGWIASQHATVSFILASQLQRELVRTLGMWDIGVLQGGFLVIRATSMPSVLVELGFLSNSREEALMRTDEFRKNSADAVVRGLINYFK